MDIKDAPIKPVVPAEARQKARSALGKSDVAGHRLPQNLSCFPGPCDLPKMGIKMPEMGNTATTKGSRLARRKAAASLSAAPTSLADALFTTTQQRVLALLFGQAARSFYASELIELTGSGSGAVQRELKRLASSGLVTVKHIGNQKHYQANPAAPVFDELRGLVKKTVAQADGPDRQRT
jgi:predicted transcriptional regulator